MRVIRYKFIGVYCDDYFPTSSRSVCPFLGSHSRMSRSAGCPIVRNEYRFAHERKVIPFAQMTWNSWIIQPQ